MIGVSHYVVGLPVMQQYLSGTPPIMLIGQLRVDYHSAALSTTLPFIVKLGVFLMEGHDSLVDHDIT